MPLDNTRAVEDDGCLFKMERRRFQGGSLFVVAFLGGVVALSIAVVVYSVVNGPDLLTLLVYGSAPAYFIIIVAWEFVDLMPARIEVHEDRIRLFVRGRIKQEMTLDSTCEAEVSTDLDLIAFKVSPYSNSCYEPNLRRDHEDCSPICGVRIANGKSAFTFDYNQGWKLKDFGRLFEPLLGVIRRNDVAMGSRLSAYCKTREGGALAGDAAVHLRSGGSAQHPWRGPLGMGMDVHGPGSPE